MTNDIHTEIRKKISDGTITDASKEQLEKYAAALCKSGNHDYGSSFNAICGTLRTLIIVRMSEESNKEATKISKIALAVAGFALICGIVQVVLGAASLLKEATIQVQYPTSKATTLPQKVAPTMPTEK